MGILKPILKFQFQANNKRWKVPRKIFSFTQILGQVKKLKLFSLIAMTVLEGFLKNKTGAHKDTRRTNSPISSLAMVLLLYL